MHSIEIVEEASGRLAEVASIPIGFRVEAMLDVVLQEHGLGGIVLVERRLAEPFDKDYDTVREEGPATWSKRFDVSRWGLLVACAGTRWIGSAVLAFATSGVLMLEGRNDLAVLWDLRVRPEYRGRGVGHRLFNAAEVWALTRRCRQLKIETQNTNVVACRFYVRNGCELGAIHRHAYSALPDEVQLLWYKELVHQEKHHS